MSDERDEYGRYLDYLNEEAEYDGIPRPAWTDENSGVDD